MTFLFRGLINIFSDHFPESDIKLIMTFCEETSQYDTNCILRIRGIKTD